MDLEQAYYSPVRVAEWVWADIAVVPQIGSVDTTVRTRSNWVEAVRESPIVSVVESVVNGTNC